MPMRHWLRSNAWPDDGMTRTTKPRAGNRTMAGPVPGSGIHRILLGAGLLGAVLFPVTYVADGALRPGYNALAQPISDLAIGPGAAIPIANFMAYGALILLSGLGWRSSLDPGRAAWAYPALKLVTGAALIATGFYHQGSIHNAVSYASLIATVAGMLVLALRFRRAPQWRGWAAYAVLSAVTMMALLSVYGSLVAHGSGGIFEKLATMTGSLFTVLVTVRVLARGAVLA